MDYRNVRSQIETLIDLYKIFTDCNKGHMDSNVTRLDSLDNECTEKFTNVLNYLESLSQIEVSIILAVMYAGRDYVICVPDNASFVPFEKHYKTYSETEKNSAIQQITDKRDLVKYLNSGMNYYEREFYY